MGRALRAKCEEPYRQGGLTIQDSRVGAGKSSREVRGGDGEVGTASPEGGVRDIGKGEWGIAQKSG